MDGRYPLDEPSQPLSCGLCAVSIEPLWSLCGLYRAVVVSVRSLLSVYIGIR